MATVPSAQVASHLSRQAGVNLASSQFRIVRLATDTGYLRLCGTSGDVCHGVLQNAPASGEIGDIVVLGGTKVELGATLIAGDRIMSNTSGQAIRWTSGQHCIGWITEGGASGSVVGAIVTGAGGVSVS